MIENRKNRNNIEIIANILEISKNGIKKTRIMYLAYLSFDLLKKYLNFLIDKNLLEYNSIEKKYKTTNKGMEFLKEYYELKEIENKHKEKLRMIQKVIGS
ncbi:MAG: winged helix-turn-helix domain-containing protein [Candidatus Methanomethylicaceae archaeon]